MELGIVIGSSLFINWHCDEAYMDEFFHVRQLETYLDGEYFKWDPKITTLPGLYFFFLVILKIFPLHLFFKLIHVCRIFNSLLTIPCYFLLKPKIASAKPLIFLFPPFFMSSCLFYTDTISLLSILAYNHCLSKKFTFLRFFTAAFAIFCRQTNIIWVVYFAGFSVLRNYKIISLKDLKKLAKNLKNICKEYTEEVLVGILFLLFIYTNKGIAVGDKENHKPVIHLVQICYLIAVIILFKEITIQNMKKAFKNIWWVGLIPINYFIVKYFTILHAFLLSDNRHYTFYIWKIIIEPCEGYISIFYSFAFGYCFKLFNFESLLWLVCSALVLIPSPLIEPRYFIMPLVTYFMSSNDNHSLIKIYFLVIFNIITILIFSYKPYKDIRFMW